MQNVVGTKWVFHNKQDEHGVVTRNKARLLAKGYSQVKDLDFDETFAPVSRLESILILVAYATHHDFMLYQMGLRSAFLNGPIKKRCMWSNHPALKVKSILTMFINSIRCSMGLSKHQEHGMNALGIFLLKIVLGLVRRFLLSSIERWAKICLYAKYMLTILSLALLTNLFVMSLAKS
jgi:hypothetical protein